MAAVLPARPTPEAAPQDHEVGLLGMWIFLVTELLFFGGLFLAYAVARAHAPEAFALAGAHTHVVLGTINTALLLTASALVAGAVSAGEADRASRAVPWLLGLAAALGVAFLAVKGAEYVSEWHEHLVPGPDFALRDVGGAQLFFVLYWTMTALHGVHVAVGVAVLALFARGTHRLSAWATPRRVEVAGLYWHFVDLVWIVLYPLLYLMGRHP